MNFDEENSSHSALTVTLVVSCLLHVLFLTVKLASNYSAIPEPQAHEPIEITEVPKEFLKAQKAQSPKSKEQVIAESDKAENDEVDPNAKFLGERNQKAEKQTRAQQIDDFRRKQGTGGKGPRDKENALPPTQEKQGQTAEAEEDGVLPKNEPGGVKRNWKTLSIKDLSVGGDGDARAATDDNLEGVDTGENTILSTREFKFYSYYHRIKELLRQHWKPNVEHQLVRLWRKGRNLSSDEFVTRVLVTLDTNGKLQKVSRLGSSGVEEIDEAAITAFQKAAPFPNPPHGMIDEDGYVRIRWDFILKADTGPAIQFRTAGGGVRH